MSDTISLKTIERASSAKPVAARPERRWLPWLRRAVVVLVALALVAAIVWAWSPKPLLVDGAVVARGRLEVTVAEDWRARVKDRYVVSAPLGGNLERIELDPGDELERGQVIARVLPVLPPLLDVRSRTSTEAQLGAALAAKRRANAQIERVRATLEYAERDAARSRELAKAGSVSTWQLEQALLAVRTGQSDLESFEFAARVAEHEVEMARATLDRLSPGKASKQEMFVVPSPIRGRVLKVLRESEGVVQAGTPLVEIADKGALEIVVDVLTSDAVRVTPGTHARIERWGGRPLEGRVRQIEPSAFTRLSALGVEEQRVNVIIDLVSPRPEWAALGDGYRVEVQILVWQGDVLKVPSSAVFRQGNDWATYRIAGRFVELRKVEIGERTGREVQITDGLAAGDRVIVHPSDQVRDGARVELR